MLEEHDIDAVFSFEPIPRQIAKVDGRRAQAVPFDDALLSRERASFGFALTGEALQARQQIIAKVDSGLSSIAFAESRLGEPEILLRLAGDTSLQAVGAIQEVGKST